MSITTFLPRRRAFERGRAQGRAEAIAFLRAQAALHHDGPGTRIRRGTLNYTADALRDGRPVGLPEDMQGVRHVR